MNHDIRENILANERGQDGSLTAKLPSPSLDDDHPENDGLHADSVDEKMPSRERTSMASAIVNKLNSSLGGDRLHIVKLCGAVKCQTSAIR